MTISSMIVLRRERRIGIISCLVKMILVKRSLMVFSSVGVVNAVVTKVSGPREIKLISPMNIVLVEEILSLLLLLLLLLLQLRHLLRLLLLKRTWLCYCSLRVWFLLPPFLRFSPKRLAREIVCPNCSERAFF